MLIPGAINQGYTATENGTYTVRVTEGDCTSEVSNEIVVNTIGISENQMLGGIKVFPNPNRGEFKLMINEVVLTEIKQIVLMNVLGQIVRPLEVIDFQMVNISEFKNGVYFVNIQTTEGSITMRVVKQ